jgi:hypothetical protein
MFSPSPSLSLPAQRVLAPRLLRTLREWRNRVRAADFRTRRHKYLVWSRYEQSLGREFLSKLVDVFAWTYIALCLYVRRARVLYCWFSPSCGLLCAG